jgi:hypothetical protein
MITGQITEQEYIAAHALDRRKAQLFFVWFMVVGFITGTVLFFTISKSFGVIFMCAATGGLIGDLIQSRFFHRSKLRRLYAQVKDKVEVTYSWDNEKLILSSKYGQVTRPWTYFLKSIEHEELILLYINDVLYEIIAKRWFSCATDLNAFRRHTGLTS